ncbi:hypothetical protein CFOL_v3_10816 [Cephalotus follicularis]|uniref:Non-specific lipid-transfer protein n=1 Tax=Cephalotus follicularis TaxID=3775 RepID=A0A1Q3BH28_CEPFO|nr:hypothetical protein CFOL_v3_10816 [Cephalotus follicularis]
MAASSIALKLACVVVVCMLVGAPLAQTIPCSAVQNALAPCIPYFKSNGRGAVPQECCTIVRELKAQTNSTTALRADCACFIKFIRTEKYNFDTANSVIDKCGVKISFKISPTTNCNTSVSFLYLTVNLPTAAILFYFLMHVGLKNETIYIYRIYFLDMVHKKATFMKKENEESVKFY